MADEKTVEEIVIDDKADVAPEPEEPKPDEPVKPVEKTFTQEDMDKVAGTVRAQSRIDRDKIIADAKAEARRESENKQLLEDKNFEELTERAITERDEALAKLARRDRDADVDELLDKRKILDPDLRSMFREIPGDLSDVDKHVTAHNVSFLAAVEAEVTKRLDTSPPPQASKESEPKQIKDMTPDEWAAYKKDKHIS